MKIPKFLEFTWLILFFIATGSAGYNFFTTETLDNDLIILLVISGLSIVMYYFRRKHRLSLEQKEEKEN